VKRKQAPVEEVMSWDLGVVSRKTLMDGPPRLKLTCHSEKQAGAGGRSDEFRVVSYKRKKAH